MRKDVVKALFIAPFEPTGGLYSFITPPTGLWRLAGFLRSRGFECQVHDLNLSSEPYEDFAALLSASPSGVIGFSLTHATLPHDLSLIYLAKKLSPHSLIVAGGVEATFNHELIMSAAPLDLIVTGEGELPMLEVCEALDQGRPLEGIAGTVIRKGEGLAVFPGRPLSFDRFRESSLLLPLEDMPFERYWQRLRTLYGINPGRAGDAELQRTDCVNLITTNYCPFKCSFCSYTNFLSAGNGAGAKVHRLSADDTLRLVRRACSFHPEARTVIFRDDLFVSKNDMRIKPFCEGVCSAKERGELRRDLRFICSARVDSDVTDNLALMKKAGFALIGYGIESFSRNVLREYNKDRIFPAIEPVLDETLRAGVVPFINIILSSPDAVMDDVLITLRKIFEYQRRGCETSMYPYVLPFAGSAMMSREDVKPQVVYETVPIPGAGAMLRRAAKIVPKDPETRRFLADLEAGLERETARIRREFQVMHFSSNLRALITVFVAAGLLEQRGLRLPYSAGDVMELISGVQGVLR